MDSTELKQKAITFIQQLSNEKLEAALEYLSFLYDIDTLRTSQEIVTDSDIFINSVSDEIVGNNKNQNNHDPLLALIGTLEFDEENISDRHDELIGDILIAELQGNEYE